MAQNNFAVCLPFTLKEEGGYSNDPHDPGGATMEGITQAEYDAWRVAHGQSKQPVKQIADDEMKAIYLAQYWNQVRGDTLPAGVDLTEFDYGVNSGPVKAVKSLQTALGVAVDGHFGVLTADALSTADPATLIKKITDERLTFLKALANFKYFGTGWTARVARIEAESIAMAAPAQLAPHVTVVKTEANTSIGNVALATGAGALSIFSGIPMWAIVLICAAALIFIAAEGWTIFHKNARAAAAKAVQKTPVKVAPAPAPIVAPTAAAPAPPPIVIVSTPPAPAAAPTPQGTSS
jgi:lysozyme family protein